MMKLILKLGILPLLFLSLNALYSSDFFISDVADVVSDVNEITNVKPLRNQEDDQLQSALTKKLSANKQLEKLIAKKKIAVGLVDLTDSENARFAQINGDEMMYAASLPKIAVLLTAMEALESGALEDSPAVQKDMHLMINKSNNQASTRMIDRVGFDRIETVLTDPRYALYDKKYGGGLWVGKRYAAQGKRNPDPLKGLSHAATATQVSRFYYLMFKGELVNKERSKQMMELMLNPGLHHKFVNTLNKLAPKAKLYRKSGSWSKFHSDSILVWGPERRYILVGLVEDAEGEQIMRNLVRYVEEVLKIGT